MSISQGYVSFLIQSQAGDEFATWDFFRSYKMEPLQCLRVWLFNQAYVDTDEAFPFLEIFLAFFNILLLRSPRRSPSRFPGSDTRLWRDRTGVVADRAR